MSKEGGTGLLGRDHVTFKDQSIEREGGVSAYIDGLVQRRCRRLSTFQLVSRTASDGRTLRADETL